MQSKGIGLAANQVALPYRLFIMNVTGNAAESQAERVFLNPEIVRRKGSADEEEGCLSLPQLYGQVRRSEKIIVNAFDLDGQEFELALDELEARVVQHEHDHIDGILFIDRMTDAARREIEPRLADFESYFRRQQETGLCSFRRRNPTHAPQPGTRPRPGWLTARRRRSMALRIVLMGTGGFALPTFRVLLESRHTTVGLFTQPDRSGRGHHHHLNPLKDARRQAGNSRLPA